jgi:serine/threonine-protein kinase
VVSTASDALVGEVIRKGEGWCAMTARIEVNRVGEIVGGKYRVVRLLAEGGMGVVYEAHHAVVRRRFAVKFLRAELAQRHNVLKRFRREAEAAGALESENIAAAVDFGVATDGTPFIVMEFLVGESLAALIERAGKLPVGRAADLVAQACRGIQAAHASRIVHRDLKPENLFVCRRDDGTDLLKVLDFGVAKLQPIDEPSATRTGAMLGTVAYMAPEQARGDKGVDMRADLYALGAILYELLSLAHPHPGDSPNAILHHIATRAAVPLDDVQPGLPPALVKAVDGALAADPAARPASAEVFARVLGSFATREVWPAPPERLPSRAGESPPSTMLAPGANDAPDGASLHPAVVAARERPPATRIAARLHPVVVAARERGTSPVPPPGNPTRPAIRRRRRRR